jgi:hypothetical protein
MPGKHQKGDVVVPTFHASGTGRDLYLNPHAGQDKDELKVAIQKPLQYTDIETGNVCTLRWWTRLPASGEHKHRLKRQSAMAKRLSQLPSLDSKKVPKPGRSHSSEFRALGWIATHGWRSKASTRGARIRLTCETLR